MGSVFCLLYTRSEQDCNSVSGGGYLLKSAKKCIFKCVIAMVYLYKI